MKFKRRTGAVPVPIKTHHVSKSDASMESHPPLPLTPLSPKTERELRRSCYELLTSPPTKPQPNGPPPPPLPVQQYNPQDTSYLLAPPVGLQRASTSIPRTPCSAKSAPPAPTSTDRRSRQREMYEAPPPPPTAHHPRSNSRTPALANSAHSSLLPPPLPPQLSRTNPQTPQASAPPGYTFPKPIIATARKMSTDNIGNSADLRPPPPPPIDTTTTPRLPPQKRNNSHDTIDSGIARTESPVEMSESEHADSALGASLGGGDDDDNDDDDDDDEDDEISDVEEGEEVTISTNHRASSIPVMMARPMLVDVVTINSVKGSPRFKPRSDTATSIDSRPKTSGSEAMSVPKPTPPQVPGPPTRINTNLPPSTSARSSARPKTSSADSPASSFASPASEWNSAQREFERRQRRRAESKAGDRLSLFPRPSTSHGNEKILPPVPNMPVIPTAPQPQPQQQTNEITKKEKEKQRISFTFWKLRFGKGRKQAEVM